MWTLGLLKTIKDPKYIVYSDTKIVMIRDMYPKAKFHFLVVSKEEIVGIGNVSMKHISLLEHMQQKATAYVEKNFSNVNFKYGYHAKPSMHRLHLHVISDDMESEFLKTKKHWNSFTTGFLLNSSDVIQQLKTLGKIKIPSSTECEKMLSKDLTCHQCNTTLSNMPKLKQHIRTHNYTRY